MQTSNITALLANTDKALGDDEFTTALIAGMEVVGKEVEQTQNWPLPADATEQRRSAADAQKDMLYKGTNNVITLLETRRDAINDTMRNDLNTRVRQAQIRLERLEAEKATALDLVSSLNEQARQLQASIDKDVAETQHKIMEEKGKYNDMIGAQRNVLESLR